MRAKRARDGADTRFQGGSTGTAKAVTNRPINTGSARGSRRRAAQFLDALHTHYGPDLCFSAACVLELQKARGQARKPNRAKVADSERALDEFFASEAKPLEPFDALSHVGELKVLPGRPPRDGSGRRLWRVARIGRRKEGASETPKLQKRFRIPAALDAESRRVIEYANTEFARFEAGLRTEPIGPLERAAEDRLRRAAHVRVKG